MNSILQKEKVCYLSGRTDNLQKHHIYGAANRKTSDINGFWVWLNIDYHTGAKGVHGKGWHMKRQLKEDCQRKFEETHTREEFMSLIGRNYL